MTMRRDRKKLVDMSQLSLVLPITHNIVTNQQRFEMSVFGKLEVRRVAE